MRIAAFLLLTLLILSSCRKEEISCKLSIQFNHMVDGAFLVKDSRIYTNEAGNHFEVNELQYFISEISLWKDGIRYAVKSDTNIHYVDIEHPSSLEWQPESEFPEGKYDSLTFIFGLQASWNKTGLFLNPPERDMFWPDLMGGGYHYIKMNGKWESDEGEIKPFNLHIGIGIASDGNGNDIFFHNSFPVKLVLENCTLVGDQPDQRLNITMNINSWFTTPYTWNWNIIGGQIMQNQEAMYLAAENGKDAFTVKFEKVYPK